jgi:hypothetical protein
MRILQGSTRVFTLLLTILIMMSAKTYGQVVDPGLSDIPACISMSPGPRILTNPIGLYTVTVRNGLGDLVLGAQVRLVFDPAAIPLIAWCGGTVPGNPPGTLSKFTDSSGRASFLMQGGGCVTTQPCITQVATVEVMDPNGIDSFSQAIHCLNSPDAIDETGNFPTCPNHNNCDPPFGTWVGLSDAVFHTRAIKYGLIEPCSNFTPPFDDSIKLQDAIYLTPFVKQSTACACN